MTTTAVPDVDLEQWLKGEIEKPCEALNWFEEECGMPASWLVTISCCYTRRPFVCDACKRSGDEVPPVCVRCGADISITFTERIR